MLSILTPNFQKKGLNSDDKDKVVLPPSSSREGPGFAHRPVDSDDDEDEWLLSVPPSADYLTAEQRLRRRRILNRNAQRRFSDRRREERERRRRREEEEEAREPQEQAWLRYELALHEVKVALDPNRAYPCTLSR